MFKIFMLMFALLAGAWSVSLPPAQVGVGTTRTTGGDLATAETSAKFLNLFGGGSGGYPNYGYNYQRPTYPGYNYGYNNNGYYGNSGSYYPTSGGSYYPTTSGSYYPTTGGSYYPTTGGYPSTGGSYYPTTNILGSQGGYAGYGGYGGNGGLRQYSGYWQRDYQGQRNRGYGYYENTDRLGLPEHRQQTPDRSYGYGSSSSYRGYD
ncbi:prisilkin-39 isoform X1 [Drosophila pseudoobscura]|uniref:Prisilkin-39 isoform X1 n=1 Tax=Drosophila pseudoobscura pseudoobscura TaxID=46245 RepID=A0A6I8VK94_DROPS|nr:prisilkin-39 isoform X1 [Drosophila pseudoobscura]